MAKFEWWHGGLIAVGVGLVGYVLWPKKITAIVGDIKGLPSQPANRPPWPGANRPPSPPANRPPSPPANRPPSPPANRPPSPHDRHVTPIQPPPGSVETKPWTTPVYPAPVAPPVAPGAPATIRNTHIYAADDASSPRQCVERVNRSPGWAIAEPLGARLIEDGSGKVRNIAVDVKIMLQGPPEEYAFFACADEILDGGDMWLIYATPGVDVAKRIYDMSPDGVPWEPYLQTIDLRRPYGISGPEPGAKIQVRGADPSSAVIVHMGV